MVLWESSRESISHLVRYRISAGYTKSGEARVQCRKSYQALGAFAAYEHPSKECSVEPDMLGCQHEHEGAETTWGAVRHVFTWNSHCYRSQTSNPSAFGLCRASNSERCNLLIQFHVPRRPVLVPEELSTPVLLGVSQIWIAAKRSLWGVKDRSVHIFIHFPRLSSSFLILSSL